MKIALISDILTHDALLKEARIRQITPLNYKIILKLWKPKFLFVESAWQGHKNRWKFKIASYSDYPKRNNDKLKKIVTYAKYLGIPTVFWNKEDGVHFERFKESAKLFDHIFTVDENCISKYREIVNENVTVNTLMFAVQSKLHYFDGFNFKYNRANFVGSYSHHLHARRKMWQDAMFNAASKSELGLTAFDRNSNRKSNIYRYETLENMEVYPSVSYDKTAQIYKQYLVSLNVNTIEDSKTMFSRRVVEILACGGILVTNSTPAIEKYFKDYCNVVHNEEEMLTLFKRLKCGPSEDDLKRAKAGAEYIKKYHSWSHRLEEIKEVIGLK